MKDGRGGYRPGAGRKPGQTTALCLEERAAYAEAIAQRARLHWSKLPRKERGPKPPPEDAKAAIAFVTNLLIDQALNGDSKAAMHLDERLSGRTKQQLEIGGIPDGEPIPIAGSIAVGIYQAQFSDGRPAFQGGGGPSRPVPETSSGKGA